MKCCIPGSICRIASTSVENYFSFTEARRNLSSLSLMLLMCFNSLHAGNFFQIFARLLIVIEINFFQKYLRETIRASNDLDPDQARYYVWPDFWPRCLQGLSADDTSREKVNNSYLLQS